MTQSIANRPITNNSQPTPSSAHTNILSDKNIALSKGRAKDFGKIFEQAEKETQSHTEDEPALNGQSELSQGQQVGLHSTKPNFLKLLHPHSHTHPLNELKLSEGLGLEQESKKGEHAVQTSIEGATILPFMATLQDKSAISSQLQQGEQEKLNHLLQKSSEQNQDLTQNAFSPSSQDKLQARIHQLENNSVLTKNLPRNSPNSLTNADQLAFEKAKMLRPNKELDQQSPQINKDGLLNPKKVEGSLHTNPLSLEADHLHAKNFFPGSKLQNQKNLQTDSARISADGKDTKVAPSTEQIIELKNIVNSSPSSAHSQKIISNAYLQDKPSNFLKKEIEGLSHQGSNISKKNKLSLNEHSLSSADNQLENNSIFSKHASAEQKISGISESSLSANRTMGTNHVSSERSADVIDQVKNYITQMSYNKDKSVGLSVHHDLLGRIDIKVNKGGLKDLEVKITVFDQKGLEFFQDNKVNLMNNLTNAGLKITDFKIESQNTFLAQNNDRPFNQSQDNLSQQGSDFNNRRNQEEPSDWQRSQKRNELWELLRDRG